MDISTAQQAAQIAAQIAVLQPVIAQIQTMISEGWTITRMEASAPAQGSSFPAGTVFNMLPAGPANHTNSQLALNTALQTYQSALDALTAQLAAL